MVIAEEVMNIKPNDIDLAFFISIFSTSANNGIIMAPPPKPVSEATVPDNIPLTEKINPLFFSRSFNP